MPDAEFNFTSNQGHEATAARGAFAAVICAILFMAANAAHAQYVPIPNYTGIGAGEEFRNDLNNHLSGTTAIAPRLVSLPFASLPAEQDGQLYWCKDCTQTNPCVGGGSGALALGAQGQWSCASGGTGGGAAEPINSLPPQTGNYSANSHKIISLAADTTTGDALSNGQSTMNSLAVPSANVAMNSKKFSGLAAGSTAWDSLAYGQGGAVVADLRGSLNQVIQVTNPPAAINSIAVTAAKCDGSTDDQAAINGIINAAGGGTSGFGAHNLVPPIQLPPLTGTTGGCVITKPVELPFANINFGGQQGTAIGGNTGAELIQKFYGPAIISAPYAATTLSTTAGPSTVSGAPVAMNLSNIFGTSQAGLLLSHVMDANGGPGLNGKGGSGFCVDYWWKPATASAGFNQPVFGAEFGEPNVSGNPSLNDYYTNTGTTFISSSNWTGGQVNITSSAVPAVGSWNFIRHNFTGGTETLYINGVSKGTASYSGTLKESVWDVWTLPPTDFEQEWPYGDDTANVYNGAIYGIRIENAACASPTSVPTAPETGDANTLFLLNFDKPADGYTHAWQQAYYGSSGTPNIFLPFWNIGQNSQIPVALHLHDITFASTGGYTSNGPYLTWSYNSEMDHLNVPAGDYNGYWEYGDFQSTVHDNKVAAAIGFAFGAESDMTFINNNDTQGGTAPVVGFAYNQVNGSDKTSTLTDTGSVVYSTVADFSGVEHEKWQDDAEDANTVKLCDHYSGGEEPESWIDDQDTAVNNTPTFCFNGNWGPNIVNDYVIGGSSSMPEYLDVLNGCSGSPAKISGTEFQTSYPAETNNYDCVIDLDNSDGGRGLKTVTFATLGTATNGRGPYYCKDCTVANPCAGSGTGAIAKALNSAWVCN